jgi:putative transposase
MGRAWLAVMRLLNSSEFKDLPPSQIVPCLADAGQYLASESTMYRLLYKADQMTHRRIERVPRKANLPRALVATRPDQVFCWDITYLPAPVRGMHLS